MPVPDFWGGGGYEGKWICVGNPVTPRDPKNIYPKEPDIWLGGQKANLTELLRPPTYEERRDLTSYYDLRDHYRANFCDVFGMPSRFTHQDIQDLMDLAYLSGGGDDDITIESFRDVLDRIRDRWFIESECDRWLRGRAGSQDHHDYYSEM